MDKRNEIRDALLERKNRRERQAGRNKIIAYTVLSLICILLIVVIVMVAMNGKDGNKSVLGGKAEETSNKKIEKIMDEAQRLAAGYDYDAAIALLQSIEDYEKNKDVQAAIDEYGAIKENCVPVNIDEVTHIFYHSLVVDSERAFGNQDHDNQAVGNNQWMTTVSEFNKITQEMYDRGFVMVSIHDLVKETTDADGNTIYEANEILLPKDKKAFVLSLDDLCYYHAYDGYGYAARLILDENGKVVNEYIDKNGDMQIGLYDVVPLMDAFVEKHPDASYRGAKGIIALTGYNGILGYRTDETYDLNNKDCDIHQQKWIKAHPDFNLETERANAKKVADAMKANGWEFASHTWGHVRVGDRSLATIQADTGRWKRNIEPLVGETDTIIFAHGQDLQGPGAYDESDAKFQYLKSEGYRFFCNVDSTQYQTFIGKGYVRQGRRNLDGYRIYYNAIGQQNNVSDLFDAKEILDPERPPVKEL